MSLFGLLFGSDDSAQASADYQDHMGGWHNPDPAQPRPRLRPPPGRLGTRPGPHLVELAAIRT
jgi:hypothetical protein